ncbi:alpha/beta hydrolase [Nocardioides terrisoli]|uniref:alpha/beta hydrolase n=1 Tax=Nocardioides terrisoli TaxID=3388267 RepID=UPI00287BB317|nr:alpha/beta fold hydrolase [Nocardioides marmorisolisilvae]
MSADVRIPPYSSEGRAGSAGRRVGVLLSHGFTGSPASMTPWGEYLAAQGYAVEVPRLPGHGTSVQDMLRTRWDDWAAEVERTYAALAARTDAVVVGGLSMGGTLALHLAEQHPEIAGVVLVNAAVASTNRQLLAVPLLKHVVRSMPAIGNDIKKPGVDEAAYDRTPLKPLASMTAAWKRVRADLDRITCPLLLFRSAEDHVVDPSSGRIILGGVSSRDLTERLLTNSYHVATIDNDAEQIYEESAAFVARVTSDG